MRRIVPKTVCLPGGYCIEVHLLSEDKANEEMGSGVWATWDVEDRVISLRSSRKTKDRREDFSHEFAHAVVDWSDWFNGKSEVQP